MGETFLRHFGSSFIVFLLGYGLYSLAINVPGPYLVIYFAQAGVVLSVIAFSLSANRIIALIANYPAGIFTDRYGRIKSFSIGATIMGLAFIALSWLPTTLTVLLYSALSGLGVAFIRGSLEAWLVDAFSEGGKPPMKEISTAKAIGTIANAASGVVASMPTCSLPYNYLFLISGLLLFSSITPLLTLKDNYGAKSSARVIFSSLNLLRRRAFLTLISYTACSWAGIYFLMIFWPLILVHNGLRGDLIGVTYTALLGSMAVGSAIARRASGIVKCLRGLSLISLCIAIIFGFLASYRGLIYALALLAAFEVALGAYTVLLAYVRNAIIPSEARASAISLMSTFNSVATAVLTPLMAKLGVEEALKTYAVLTVTSSILPFIILRSKRISFINLQINESSSPRRMNKP